MFNFSPQLLSELTILRTTGKFSFADLSLNESLYLQTEEIIRNDRYNEWPELSQNFTDLRYHNLSQAYYQLFTNPSLAIFSAQELLNQSDLHPDLYLRIQYWLMDAYFLTGQKEKGLELLNLIKKPDDQVSPWKGEAFAILALDMYFLNRNEEALKYHLMCQKHLQANPDLFLITFNASMALRIALKICDPIYFDYFSNILTENIHSLEEKRYSLRIHSYRGLILEQMTQFESAKQEWAKAETLSNQVQMSWEKGQYFLIKGLSEVLKNNSLHAQLYFDQARTYLNHAGMPKPYLAELILAETIKDWQNINYQTSLGFSNLLKEIEKAKLTLLMELEKNELLEVRTLINEGLDYLKTILSGGDLGSKNYFSLVLSIFINKKKLHFMGENLKEFKLYTKVLTDIIDLPTFDVENIKSIIEKYFSFSPEIHESKLKTPQILMSSHLKELDKIITFSNRLIHLTSEFKMSQENKVKELYAKRLSHDLQSPLAVLKQLKIENYLSPFEKEAYLSSIDKLKSITQKTLKNKERSPQTTNLLELMMELSRDKMIEYNRSIEIKHNLKSNYNIFTFSKIDLVRMFSNFINNSVEAGASIIDFMFTTKNGFLNLIIYDNGPQILNSTSKDVMIKEESTKVTGHGLGLTSAKTLIEKNGGTLDCYLDHNNQFTIDMKWPRFKDGREIKLIHLEDDTYLRYGWKKAADDLGVDLLSFEKIEDLKNQTKFLSKEVIFFLDEDIAGTSSLPFIESLVEDGFKNIHLSTGNYDFFENPPKGVQRVIGKDFPSLDFISSL